MDDARRPDAGISYYDPPLLPSAIRLVKKRKRLGLSHPPWLHNPQGRTRYDDSALRMRLTARISLGMEG